MAVKPNGSHRLSGSCEKAARVCGMVVKMVAGVIVKMAALRLAAHWRRESGGARTGCGQVAGAPLLNAPLKGG